MKLPVRAVTVPRVGSVWPQHARALHRLFRTTAGGEKLSLAQIAARSGLSMSGVRFIMNGQRRPSLESGLKLAGALGRAPWWLVEYSKRVRILGKPGITHKNKRLARDFSQQKGIGRW